MPPISSNVKDGSAILKYQQYIRANKTLDIMYYSTIVIGERAKRARHYQGCTNSSWCGTYIYIYIYVWRYVCHISSACHVYVMWAELGHSHFLYVPADSNVVTNGNGTGTKNVLKGTVRLGLSLVSSLLSTAQLL